MRNRISLRLAVFLCAPLWVVLLMDVRVAYAKQEASEWSFSPSVGLHAPNLRQLNEGVFRAPFSGRADVLLVGDSSTQGTFQLKNPLPSIDYGTLAGVEFQWKMSDEYWFLIGGSSWEAASEAETNGVLPLQGVLSRVSNNRRAKLSYNEFFMGWRHNVVRRPEKLNLYYRFSLHEIFDIDYREDWAFVFFDRPPTLVNGRSITSFGKNLTILSQATGVLLLQVGVGAEVFLKKWLSVGFESNYAYGIRDFTLRNSSSKVDFLNTDNLDVDAPLRQNPQTQNLEYNSENGSGYNGLALSFNGWKALLRVSIYY